jgi:ATP-binding cassette subfamily A (ABC1) protein 7
MSLPCQVFLYFSKDQGEEEESSRQEAEEEEVSKPGRQHPKRVSRFLEDPSSVETMI